MTTLFISYSHDDEDHKRWVLRLAEHLRAVGIDVTLDQWDLLAGADVGQFMEDGIRGHDRVLVVCTPNYTSKANNPRGGVGYEKQILTGQLMGNLQSTKFIPILRNNPGRELPTCISTRRYVDFNDTKAYETSLDELAREIHGRPKAEKPPLGQNPYVQAVAPARQSTSSNDSDVLFVPEVPSLVFRLPRGFILVDSLISHGDSTWGITLNYYDLEEGWRYGTHYHSSYRNWSFELNARKMGIPEADRRHATRALDVAVWIRTNAPTLAAVRAEVSSDLDVRFFDAKAPISLSTLPTAICGGKPWTSYHALRDIEFEMQELTDKAGRCTHADVRELRMVTLMEAERILPAHSTALLHLQEAAATYRPEMPPEDLRQWMTGFRRMLSTAVTLFESKKTD
jgi:hypothetical protein